MEWSAQLAEKGGGEVGVVVEEEEKEEEEEEEGVAEFKIPKGRGARGECASDLPGD